MRLKWGKILSKEGLTMCNSDIRIGQEQRNKSLNEALKQGERH